MKKTKIIFLLTFSVLALPIQSALAQNHTLTELPSYPVTLNGILTATQTSNYPPLVYNNITYIPLTYQDARLLGLKTCWTLEQGLSIEKLDVVPEQHVAQQQYIPYISANTNANIHTAVRPSFAITINGKTIDNNKEEYPLLVFRNVTYFPLTWRFAVDEFGWNYTFDAENGLKIDPVPTQLPTEISVQKTVFVTGDVVNLRSGAGKGYPALGQVSKGTSFALLNSGKDSDGKVWYQVQSAAGSHVWIASWLVKVTESVSADKTATQKETAETTDTIIANGSTVYVTGDVVNLRTGAGTSYERAGQVLEGDALTITGNSRDRDGKVWYQVQMEDSASLWVASWLISKNNDAGVSVSTGELTAVQLEPAQQNERKTVFSIKHGEGNLYSLDAVSDTQLKLTLKHVTINSSLHSQSNGFQILIEPTGNQNARVTLNYAKGGYVAVIKDGDWLNLNCYQNKAGLAGRTIVLDPGHGGIDVGGQGRTMKHVTDADVGYTVAVELQKLLEAHGATVVLTRGALARNERVFMTERIAMSNSLEPDIYISIHANSTEGETKATGAETYTYNGKIYSLKVLAENLAQKIRDGLAESTGEKSVTKAANFYVLRMNHHPSALVECAYLSNPHDEQLLATASYRQKLAEGIYKGIVEYFNQFE